MKIFTIGFTKKSAETFFTRLQQAGVKRLVDVRLNNVSQLAGFAKRDDLRYFTKTICGIDYKHVPDLAPTAFLDLMKARRIEDSIPRELLDGACLLCSEEKPHHCHRRLVAEYLKEKWDDVVIDHIP